MTEINEGNFQDVVAGAKLVVIDFWATWCGPCKRLASLIEELAAEYEGKAVVCKCDIEENPDLTEKFGIMSVPTVIFLKDGEVADTLVGVAGKQVYESKINAMLG